MQQSGLISGPGGELTSYGLTKLGDRPAIVTFVTGTKSGAMSLYLGDLLSQLQPERPEPALAARALDPVQDAEAVMAEGEGQADRLARTGGAHPPTGVTPEMVAAANHAWMQYWLATGQAPPEGRTRDEGMRLALEAALERSR